MSTKSSSVEVPANNGHLPPGLDIAVESLRCTTCGRHLAYYAIIEGTVAIKCRKCKNWTIVDLHILPPTEKFKEAADTCVSKVTLDTASDKA